MVEALAREWTRLLAPATGHVRTELVREAAEFLGMPIPDVDAQLHGAAERFRDEWLRTVGASTDAATLARFYNESQSEIFDLIEWHASDPIHYRTLVVRDFLRGSGRPRGAYLDYGSGIGNDALVFAEAGFEVTLADVSEPLLAFAAWRCRRRGFAVKTIDLKRDSLPPNTFDLVVCFDVLEHILKPLDVVRQIRTALHEHGIFVVHAPFGPDPDRPMHVIHRDVITSRMRSLGFKPLPCDFPPPIHSPKLYEKCAFPALDRASYYLYDHYLNNAIGARLAVIYRRAFPLPPLGSST
jgi:SAM-dependent methyltransferase